MCYIIATVGSLHMHLFYPWSVIKSGLLKGLVVRASLSSKLFERGPGLDP